MAKINLTDEILKHDDAEIIELLYDTMKDIRLTFNGAMEQNDPSVTYAAFGDVELVTDVLRKLYRRNQEKAL